ncbi:SrtB family sortase [Carnobacterium divergens]|uniref:class B sortase n=1 Tax=Carnobacterium divergens TaxID=2748 RepID=UPI000D41D376|nr:class B sortase [Carnobacterium divergens]MCO6017930.1 class B sortase [Carnobacterium divergens]TFI61761.1 SrtB family sortase [Carnobacterium divergens]TFI89033.1 SrtB family sortase [Carnobacterium divergens]TFJ03186.1 SrtB family sortase [Carnobacterium divergens]TFJ05347.1 SrtB family sortase [Carnobacterium divergens]
MKRKLLSGVMLIVLLFSGWKILTILTENQHNQRILADVQKVYQKQAQQTRSVTSKKPAFVELKKINPDIKGWISIPDTAIDYPILQSSDNDFYLKHNYQKEIARAGSVFKDFRNQSESEFNTILYGHNMKDGSMFADLQNYLDEDFFNKHPTFDYETETKSYQVEVFAAYETTTDFYYIETDFSQPQAYSNYLTTIKQQSKFQTNVIVTDQDQIITLSTCDTGFDYEKGRFVIQGKLIEK